MKQSPPVTIVYIITQLDLGGAQKVCLALFEHLADAKHYTHLIAGDQGILAPSIASTKNVHLISALQREVSLRAIINEIRCFFTLIRQLRSIKRTTPGVIVHTHSTKAGLIGRWAALFARIPIRIHTVHGFSFHNHQPKIIWAIHYALELFTSIITTHYICVSSADNATGTRLLPGFKNKQSLIRAAVQEAFYTPAQEADFFPTSGKPFVFGAVACFKPQKNIFDLLHAFAYVYERNQNVRLEIIGDGQLRPAIETWIKNNGLEKIIILHGWQADVAPHMLTWHAFVLSSLWEGLPCAVVEARLLKLPVLSYATGGISDIVKHDRNGLLFQQKALFDLAQGMLQLSRSPGLHNRLRSYSDTLEQYSYPQMIAQHKQLYAKFYCAWQ